MTKQDNDRLIAAQAHGVEELPEQPGERKSLRYIYDNKGLPLAIITEVLEGGRVLVCEVPAK